MKKIPKITCDVCGIKTNVYSFYTDLVSQTNKYFCAGCGYKERLRQEWLTTPRIEWFWKNVLEWMDDYSVLYYLLTFIVVILLGHIGWLIFLLLT